MKSPVAAPPAVIATARFYEHIQRLPLWSHPLAHHRLLLACARYEEVVEVHPVLPREHCFLSDGSQEAWTDPQSEVHISLRGPDQRLLLPEGFYVLLGECTIRYAPSAKYFPRDEYPVEDVLRLTLKYARNQARLFYRADQAQKFRTRFEALDELCRERGIR